MLSAILSFVIALALSWHITPLIRTGAIKLNIVDRPDGKLKNQETAIPYLGGVAVFISFLFSLALTFSDFDPQVMGLLLGGSIVVMLGIIDDVGNLPPEVKLMGEVIAALAMIKCGIMIRLSFIPEWISIPLTFFWLVGMTNALNLIDIMDGLSAGVSFVSCFFLFVIAQWNHNQAIAVATLALAGSLLGFLRYNFFPAKIYLGDAGSLLLGLLLGAMAMIGRYTERSSLGLVAPLMILGVPLFEMIFVSYIRYRRGMSILRGSNDHFALRLRKWALSKQATVLLAYGISVVLGVCSLILISVTTAWAGLIVFLVIAFFLLAGYLLKKIDMTM
ncbi:MAG: MraY family glycosyltransferase [bacterium]